MQNITIDITKRGVAPLVNVTDYDAMSRFFALTLMDGGTPYTPPENPNYSVWYKNNESHGWYDTITEPDDGTHPAVTADGNVLTVEIAEAATTSCGELAVMITGADGYQLTVTGIMTRSSDIPGYDGEEVENYYNVYITEMRENAARAENAAATAIEYGASVEVDETAQQLIITHTDNTEDVQTWVTEAEAWAVGQRNGEDVPSTDETYHNNAKYYAQVAQESAGGASPIVTEASGSVAAFPDGADDVAVKSLVAEITPILSGNGDPSPTNVRAISGRTGLTVTREGKNILNPSAMVRGSVFVDNGDGTYTFSKVGTGASGRITWSSPIKADNGTTVTFSANITGTHESEIYIGFTLDESTGGASAECTVSNGRITGTVTSTGHMNGIRLYWRNNSTGVGTDSVVLSNMQVEYGSTATAYEPYAPTTYPITWESIAGTVYGGTLDVVSGVLTVDKVLTTFDGTGVTWEKYTPSSGNYCFRTTISDKAVGLTPMYANSYKALTEPAWGTSDYGVFSGHASLAQVYFRPPNASVAEVADWNTWLAANNLQVVYPLATPQTYNITPISGIKTLLGGNTIYTDAGAVSVEYVADTKLYIDNKVAELQALILEN